MNEMTSRFVVDDADAEAEAVAIVGIAGRFPGAGNPREFWRHLCEGVESMPRFTERELEDTYSPEVRQSPDYVPVRPILDNVDQFDAAFFGMLPREAALTDPQQRVFLECCWEALEDAGYDPSTYKGAIGVFAGSSHNTYLLKHVCGSREGIERFTNDFQVGSYQELQGSLSDFVATRVCYKLNLRGPGVTVQSACSTSLLAIAQACQSLLLYQSDMALAGGVSITFPQKRGYLATEGAMVAPDGHCRPFDANATGTIFGSGAGAVLLKRLSDAVADKDQIWGVIRGFGVNNDGSGKAGFTAPSVQGQAAVISLAQAMAGISGRDVGFVETHGTATQLGDPIEFAGLVKAFRETTDEEGFCWLGSGKANVGHLDAAAGVTGVIKTVLTLRNEAIPPLLHFKSVNPHIDLEHSPFRINTELVPWPRGEVPRYAGVSSFGVGGTNVHLVIGDARANRVRKPPRDGQLLVLSARSQEALARMAQNLADRLDEEPGIDLGDAAFTLQVGRKRFKHRAAVVAMDRESAIAALRGQMADKAQDGSASNVTPKVAFMFPGQGAQYVGMGAGLYEREPVFRAAFDACCKILAAKSGIDLKAVLFDNGGGQDAADRLRDTAIAQPAIFSLEYALARLWISWGITPSVMVGHSIGEFAAATIAGVFELPDVLSLVAARGELMHDVDEGGMLSVRMSEAEVRRVLPPALSIAALNAPSVTVVAGPFAELNAFEAQMVAAKVPVRKLVTSHAFHSSMMDGVADDFRALVESVPRSRPKSKLLSTLTGRWMTDEQALDAGYWARHLREAVRFSDAVAVLRKEDDLVLLEVGPGNTLNTLARMHAGRADQAIASSLGGPDAAESEAETILSALGTLWISGVEPDWEAVHGEDAADRARVSLPSYPFERKRHWIEPPSGQEQAATPSLPAVASQNRQFSNVPRVEATAMAYDTTAAIPAAALTPPVSDDTRQDRIRAALTSLFADMSGMDLSASPRDASFLDLGFDSLFLTQAAREILNKIGVKIAFRQLLGDLSTFDAVAAHADKKLPPEAFPAKPVERAPAVSSPAPVAVDAPVAAPADALGPQQRTVAAVAPVQPAPGAGDASALERVMREQMQAMNQLFAQQLGTMQGILPVPAQQPTPVPRPATVEVPAAAAGQTAPAPAPAPAPRAPTAPVTAKQELAGGNKEFQPFGPYKPLQTARLAGLTPQQEAKVRDIVQRYTSRTATSKAQTQSYRRPLADPRVVSGFRENWKEMVYPIVTNRSKGSRLWDVDGNEYIDMLNGFGPIMFGHRPDFVERALEGQLHEGFEIGPQTPLAGEIAAKFCAMTGNERMTFCNTGSEAVMAALRLARTVTGRDTVLAFSGDYHGMFDEVLIKAGRNKAGAPVAQPIAPGIPRESVANMVVLDYGTPETLEWIRANAGSLAAVLTEPIQSRRPGFLPVEFLREVREITKASGTALIFDEVVTGFRVHPGGCQALFDIRADMATYGKVLGGGMPIGVLAGTAEYMDALDGGYWQYGDASVPEVGVTFFAGTFVRHPLTLAAVKAVLEELERQGPALQERLTKRMAGLVERLNAVLERYGMPSRVQTSASIMNFAFPPEEKYASLFYYLLRERGIHILEGFPCYLTTAHTDADLDAVVAAFESVSAELAEAGLLGSQEAARAAAAARPVVSSQPRTIPLTESQREIFLAAMLGLDVSCAFNESVSTRLDGPLDAEALKRAVNAVIARHETLRASVSADGASLDVRPHLEIEIDTVDLSDLATDSREADYEQLLADDARTAFAPTGEPLVRGFLVKMGATEHILVLTLHHIVSDGWSNNVILGEIAEHYSAAVEKRAPRLQPVLAFSEYAARQTRERDSEAGQAAQSFWLERFKSVPPLIELPTDRPRGGVRTYAGATLKHRVAKDQLQEIKQLGARHGVSLFATLLAGFDALVARLSGQTEVVVGVPLAGQAQEGGRALVGHCVNFLPLRATVLPDARFSDLMAQVKDVVLDAYDQQEFTYGTLVQKLGLKRDPSRLPLTELQFNLEQVGSGTGFSRLASRSEANPKAAINSDMFVNCVEHADGLTIECDYNTDLFDAATIRSWLDALVEMLRSAVADPARAVADLALPATIRVSRAARQVSPAKVPAVVKRPVGPAMTTAGEETIVDLFARQVGLRPDAVALSDGTRRITYAELDRLSTAVAARLVAKGVRPGDMVALCLDRSAGIVISQVAVLKAGATYVPLDASHPRERLDFMLEDTGAKVVLAQRVQAERALGGVAAEVLLLEEAMEGSGAATAALPDPQLTPDSAAYVIFTSGSTGKPKGVLVTHRNVARLLSATHDWYKFDERDVWTLFHSYAFDFSVWEIWGALLYGGRVVVVPFQVSRSPREFYDLLADEGVTILNQTPAAFYNLIDVEENGHVRPLALREVIFGGEALNFKALRPWFARHGDTKPRLVNMYGITETTVHVTYRPVSKADTEGDPGSLIGVPIPDLAIYLLDEQGNPVADGEVGEIYVGGLGVARGYLNRAELTSERFLPDPFNPVAGARMYRSGDLARRTPEGDLEYHGRADMQVKVRGFRIELGEIEAAMLQVPGIRKVSVVADHDGSGSTRLVGFFVAEPQATVPQDAIVAKLKQLLPEYMVPVAFVPVASIPLTVNGKVDRASLLAAEKEQRSKRVQEAPATAAEGTLAGIVAEVLRLEKVGVTDNLFELGVDSLKIFQITSRAGKAGVAVTPRSVLQARTIRGALAMAAAAPAHSAASAIKPAARQRLRIDRGTGASPKA